jgi:hypothetical protein
MMDSLGQQGEAGIAAAEDATDALAIQGGLMFLDGWHGFDELETTTEKPEYTERLSSKKQ